MKITFVTSTLTSGGSERVMSILANELADRGHNVSIILLRAPNVFYSINDSVKLYFAQDFSKNIMGKALWLRKHIQKERPDVVIPFMTSVYCVTIFALLGVNVPIISSERIDPRFSNRIIKITRWAFLRFTTHLVVQTQAIKAYYSQSIQQRTTIIPNPITEKVFEKPTDINKKHRIISVGRLYDQKNQKMMINAFSQIANQYPDYTLVIYGEGPLRQELENYIKSLGLESKVLLPGRTENIVKELYDSEVFCLSSDYEGMSNALLEAVCVGMPVISTRVSGADDILINGENGLVVNIGDVDGLVVAFQTLLNNKELCDKFSKYNKQISVNYKIEKIVDNWEALMHKVVGLGCE
ncbi:MAG: glycosyltransferase [Alistipes sp.]|nr:glycosyltransferase [Alistipes sp.]